MPRQDVTSTVLPDGAPIAGPNVTSVRKGAAREKITVQPLRGNISVLMGSGGNIAVLNGRDGKVLVDASFSRFIHAGV